MAPAKGGPMNQFQPPLTGHEKRVSAMQRFRQELFQKSEEYHQNKLKNMKPGVDNSPPRSMYMQQERDKGMSSRQQNDVRRKMQIAEDNLRLLQNMTKIYKRGEEQSIQGVFEHANAIDPAFYLARSRQKKLRDLQTANKAILKRIETAKPYYSNDDFVEHSLRFFKQVDHRCISLTLSICCHKLLGAGPTCRAICSP